MSKDEILKKVNSVVRDQLDDDTVELRMTTVASSVDGWDSLAHVRIMIALEEEFGIQFETSQITSMKNVGDMVSLIHALS